MNIHKIDTLIYDMNTVEKSHLLHYLLGYAKQNKQFCSVFVDAINERHELEIEVST